MIRCEQALARLWEFIDGELEGADQEEIRRHIEVCSRCYPRYDFQRAYFELMRRIRARGGVSPRLRRRIFERILEEEAASRDEDGAGGVA